MTRLTRQVRRDGLRALPRIYRTVVQSSMLNNKSRTRHLLRSCSQKWAFSMMLPVYEPRVRQYAGFSDVAPWIMPDANASAFNVAVETGDPGSLLSHYRTLIALRKVHPALRTGELFLLSTFNQGLFACLRTTPDESVLVIVNLTGSPIRDYRLSLAASPLLEGEVVPVPLSGQTPLAALTVLPGGYLSDFVPVPRFRPTPQS